MIGKLIIERDEPYKAYDYKEPPSLKDKKKKTNNSVKYDAGQDFIDKLLTGNVALVGIEWFGLPGYEEIRDEFIKRFNIPHCTSYIVNKKELKERVRI